MKIPMKRVEPTPQMLAFVNDLKATFARHPHLSAEEMLAGASQIVGTLVALQDQRSMTPDMAMQIVGTNIEEGNQMAMREVASASGSSN